MARAVYHGGWGSGGGEAARDRGSRFKASRLTEAAMKFYRLEIAPDESEGEGEDHDEWFSSLEGAKRRRSELIRRDPHLDGHRYGSDFAIHCVVLKDLPKRALVLAVLNRRGYTKSDDKIVSVYCVPREGRTE
jgi:hypothetical protein